MRAYLTNNIQFPFFAESSLYSEPEDSAHLRRKGSLYIDLGAMTGYYNLVRGPPATEYG